MSMTAIQHLWKDDVGQFWFNDETCEMWGPYSSTHSAYEAFKEYCHLVLGEQNDEC